MEGTEEFFAVATIFGIFIIMLNIVLFFKIWMMTNDTAKIKDMLQEWFDIEYPIVEDQKKKDK